MQKYVVISYDMDEQQTFWDVAEAQSPEEARAIIDAIRDYAIAVDALTTQDLHTCVDTLESFTSESIRETLDALRAERGMTPDQEPAGGNNEASERPAAP